MARTAALLILTAETGLTRYFEEIRRFPMLERQQEYMLAKRWREHGDREAAQGARLGALHAQRARTPHLRGAAAGRGANYA